MKKSKALLCTLLCTPLCAFTMLALSAEPGQPPEREKAVMLYFTRSFGSEQQQNRTPLAFGLRLQQSTPSLANRPVALLDARYSLDGRKTLALGGVEAFDWSASLSSSSSSSSGGGGEVKSGTKDGPKEGMRQKMRKHPVITTTVIILGLAGISCATENFPCKSSGGYRSPEGETPSPGGG